MTSIITRYQSAYREYFGDRAPEVSRFAGGFVIQGSVCDSGVMTANDMELRIASLEHWASERRP